MADAVEELLTDEYEVVFEDEDDETGESGSSVVWDSNENVLRVLKDKCSTCIYGSNRFVSARTVRAMEEETLQDERSHVQCHHTLPSISGSNDVGAICRGWWDRNAMKNWLFRLAKRDDVVKFVDEPPARDGVELKGAGTCSE